MFINIYEDFITSGHKDDETATYWANIKQAKYKYTIKKNKDGSWVEINLKENN